MSGRKKCTLSHPPPPAKWPQRPLPLPCLEESATVFAELVIVLELHCDGLVAVQAGKLHVGGVAHIEGAKEVGGSDTWKAGGR